MMLLRTPGRQVPEGTRVTWAGGGTVRGVAKRVEGEGEGWETYGWGLGGGR